MSNVPLHAVSLFSNCGAGDLGYARAGFEFEVLAELDERRLEVASLNHPHAATIPGDIRETWRLVIETYRARRGEEPPALLCACPPCQGMSSARSGRGREHDADAGSKDGRNLLVDVVASVTHELRPRMVVVENVFAFLTRRVRHPDTNVPISAARLLIERLADSYRAFPMQTDLADFGVPQTRKRSFVVLVRRDDQALAALEADQCVPFPNPTHGVGAEKPHVTLKKALKKLGAKPLDSARPDTAGDGMHAVPVWDAARYQLVAAIPPNSGRGAWQNDLCPACGRVDVDDDAAVCPDCAGPLSRPVVQDGDTWRLVNGFRSSSYTRMKPDVPAATITTATGSSGSDKTIHPWENRVLSPLECAHLQTFPRDFRWGDALRRWGPTNVRAMIGEAVPPQFTEQHGRVLAGLLSETSETAAMTEDDRRVLAAARRLWRAGGDTEPATPARSPGPAPPATSPASRKIMRATRQTDTSPEQAVARALGKRGLRFSKDMRPEAALRRRADMVFTSARVAVFVDGCFWHLCPDHGTVPKSNGEWWRQKLEGNASRDRDTDRRLREMGWAVVRVWEHEDPESAADRVAAVVAQRAGTGTLAART